MYLETHKEVEQKMKKTVKVFSDELKTIRAGRANPALLDKVMVNYYGTATPLKQISNISVPEARQLLISPWDANALPDIEKAIMKSDLGLNPSNDGKTIRLIIPQLTEETRKDMIKVLGKITEGAKVAIRNERRTANDELKKLNKNGDLTDDELSKAEDQTQKLTDNYIIEIEKLAKEKESELLEV
ncbi:ribosome recycling factor [Clostridium sp. D2Q-11]|uniref:Ribosome-recycling factor n=1 Tax=Anaeromonas frigoriresistens TaxID=2683708 RepID=A0A942UWI3_9FIRM|nr:ribosome recycling factor [Anaeromonas frigoriresistens]MBS4539878.1 ribosome recycling factor [Anaeromonas frigoriresistens]